MRKIKNKQQSSVHFLFIESINVTFHSIFYLSSHLEFLISCLVQFYKKEIPCRHLGLKMKDSILCDPKWALPGVQSISSRIPTLKCIDNTIPELELLIGHKKTAIQAKETMKNHIMYHFLTSEWFLCITKGQSYRKIWVRT